MKTLLLSALLFLTNVCVGQTLFTIHDDLLTVETIDSTLTIGKDEIFKATKLWVAKNFGSSNAVIDLEDADAGTLVLKYRFEHKYVDTIKSKNKPILLAFKDKATMQIDCRENKIRVRVNGIQMSIDLSGIVSDYEDDFRPLEENLSNIIKNGGDIFSFEKKKIYQELWRKIKSQEYDIIDFVKSNKEDKF